MALALYRRYRPDTFEGVIGQDQVTVPLTRALERGKFTHAYLFSGPRGCGKTSCARILARCINCAQGPTPHPCGECESCRDLASGGPGSIDVVEIDAASHNGVDDARELRERAGFAPARDRYKIFILDEAHMVTQQGFNALLKIVEEPPEHVMFIFATTEPEKVIGTIRSRTHHYPFRLVPPEVMGPFLEQVCAAEGIKPAHGVLKLAMRAGCGSVRDTLSVLDQLMAGSSSGTIELDDAVALLGFTPDALISQAVDALIDRKGEDLYQVVEQVIVAGFDPRRFVEDLLARVRDLLVLTLAGDRATGVLSDEEETGDIETLRRQANALGLAELSKIAQTINTALASMTGAISPRMQLELLAARLLAGRQVGVGGGVPEAAAAGADRQRGSIGANQADPGAGVPEAGATQAHHGFVGSRQSSGAHRTASSSSPEPAVRAVSIESAPAESVPNQGGEPKRRESASDAPASSTDELWKAVVAELPRDVAQYVGSDTVPKITLVEKGARPTLELTFDSALSQHAFALAVSTEENSAGAKAAIIVQQAVQQIFGQRTRIAPTPIAANGEHVKPIQSMTPRQLTDIKKQIALAKAGLGEAGLGEIGTVESTPLTQDKIGTSEPSSASHDEADTAEPPSASHDQSTSALAPATLNNPTPTDESRVGNQATWDLGAPSEAASPASPDTTPPQNNQQDEYSINDTRLDEASVLGVDDLATMFEAKSVKEYAADDPNNPRNVVKPESQTKAHDKRWEG